MSKVIEASNVLPVSQVVEPGGGKDLLTEVLRKGARELSAQAVEQEVQDWLSERSGLLNDGGRDLVVRNGHLPERTLLTGIGPVAVRQPRVHDRRPDDERGRFSLKILSPYLRKTKSLEELIPWLSLTGGGTGGFQEALQALLGPDCPGLSANTIVDFLAEPWKHLRTTNPMESTFATIRLRHRRTKGNGTRPATLAMLFKLAESASHHWRTLDAAMHLIEVSNDTKFQDGIILPKVVRPF